MDVRTTLSTLCNAFLPPYGSKIEWFHDDNIEKALSLVFGEHFSVFYKTFLGRARDFPSNARPPMDDGTWHSSDAYFDLCLSSIL